jgi:transcription termination/antitermination protein NusG
MNRSGISRGNVSMENETANSVKEADETEKSEELAKEQAEAELQPPAPPAPPTTAADEPEPDPGNKKWYVVKVQSGREESIRNAIERRVKIEGLQEFFGEIIIPTEKYTDMVRNKRVVKERKLYPGYLMVNVEYNDRILYLFRETSGVGDFVGAGPNKAPLPMMADEVDRMRKRAGVSDATEVIQKPKYEKGDRVKVKDGTFAGMEGEVKELLEAKGAVRVELRIFDRPVPVELEYWQVDNV